MTTAEALVSGFNLSSIKGVRNFEGILGAETLIKPCSIAVARSLGDMLSLCNAKIGPGASLPVLNVEKLS
jgi:hypothetical protein